MKVEESPLDPPRAKPLLAVSNLALPEITREVIQDQIPSSDSLLNWHASCGNPTAFEP
jgi:hypothetical protein